MLKIGEFSKLSRVSIRMLRHYDETGLLKPAAIDPFTGYRYYSEDQLPIAGRIVALRDMGFGVGTIGEILRDGDGREVLTRCLCAKTAELRTMAAQIERRMRLLEAAGEWLRKDDNAMYYNVSKKSLPERQVASVRMTIPSYDHEGMLWSVLVSETAGLHLVPDDP